MENAIALHIKLRKRFRLAGLSTRLVFFAVISMMVSSCQKDVTVTPTNTKYLVSFKKTNNYSSSFIKLMLTSMNKVYPGTDTLLTNVKYGIDVYTITYNTHFKGNPKIASGLVCIPSSTNSFPILSFQNGTNTFKQNAPTVNPADPLYTLMEMMSSHGYVVAIADYLGFGSSADMMHPYYDKVSTTDAVSDMILAVHELLDDKSVDAESDGKHYLMGYSQGGWATLAELQRAEADYPTQIRVSATSCGAGAYDITAMSDYVLAQEIYPGPLYLPYFIYSKITAGDITQPLSAFFKEPFASNIPGLFNGNYTNAEVDDHLTDTISSLVTDSLRLALNTDTDFTSLRQAMVVNSVHAFNTTSLLRFYHGTSDLNVPPVQSAIIYNEFLAKGLGTSQLTLIPIPGATHDSGLIPWGISSIMWFDSLKE
ncbi:MAG: prolyl oligopeptidase family serine peptidase [Bacteroidetes bacterium]|nr:prolyl oligopeptidase family serine peptidase [Bacteroidota bacterium]